MMAKSMHNSSSGVISSDVSRCSISLPMTVVEQGVLVFAASLSKTTRVGETMISVLLVTLLPSGSALHATTASAREMSGTSGTVLLRREVQFAK
jgi:hypothetical protein